MFSQIQAAILGVVQGLTEFLPISSSAHLTLIPWFFHWQDPGLAFDVVLHLGTLTALLVYYRKEWTEIVLSLFNGDRAGRRLLLLLIGASIPGAILGVLFEKQAENAFRSPLLIAVALAVMGLLLWFIDAREAQERTLEEITLADAVIMGLAQALALIPGVSRSGATITVARWLRINREDAANFSFLMSAPIIAGAGLLKAHELLHAADRPQLTAGFITAAIASLIAIAFVLKYVRSHSYGLFAWYRVALAAVVALVFLARAGMI